MTAHDDSLAIALAQAALGREVFPLVGKAPAVRWQLRNYASSDADRVRKLWKIYPLADGAAWRIPVGRVVLDVDDEAGFAKLVPSIPDAPSQRSTRGFHRLYRDTGVTQGRVAGVADLKVGGKGYVKLYQADAFPGDATDDVPAAVARHRESSRPKAASGDSDEPMGSRDEILSFAGRMRRAGADQGDILAALTARLADGRIVDLDDSKPWTEKDLRAIAMDIGSKPAGNAARDEEWGRQVQASLARWKARQAEQLASPSMSLATISAAELLGKKLRPRVECVPGLITEGLGMLAGGPKMGKSWLAYQIAVAVATGGEVLGRRASRGDVLYLALEDGELRAQSRIRTILDRQGTTWPREASELDIAFDAHRGDEVVAQIEEWIAARPRPALVIIDTLQKVRPPGSGRRNQYEVDVEDLGRILAIGQRNPGLAILLVHHSRKQEAADFLDVASGTHGITGSTDSALVLKRARHEEQGTLEVTGRDIDEGLFHIVFKSGVWAIDPDGGLSDAQLKALDWLRENGPAGPTVLAEVLGMQKGNVQSRVLKPLADRRILDVDEGGKYRVPFIVVRRRENDENSENSENDENDEND